MDDEGRHARVLADRAFTFFGHVNVGRNNVQRLKRLGGRRLGGQYAAHRAADVGRQIRGGLGYEFEETGGKKFHEN